MNYQEICKAATEVVMKAAAFVSRAHENRHDPENSFDVETKGKHDYVTSIDKAAEEILAAGLETLIPGCGFVAEEDSRSERGERWNWIVDPIDGTTNFIHGAYPFSISVALAEGDEIVVGIIYEFGQKELFTAWKDGGAWCNGKPIRVSGTDSVAGGLFATGFPYTNYSQLEGFMHSMDYFMKNSAGLRRLGSAACDIAWVACGRYEGFYEYGLKPWDIAAGILLVKEAGGRVCDFDLRTKPLYSADFICSNQALFEEFSTDVNRIMRKKK